MDSSLTHSLPAAAAAADVGTMPPNARTMMLAIHGKRTETVDLKNPLTIYVRNYYPHGAAADAAADFDTVQQLRDAVARMVPQPNSREVFCR